MTLILTLIRSPLVWAALLGAVLIASIWGLAAQRYSAGLEAGRAEVRAEWTAASARALEDKRAAERALEAKAARIEAAAQAEIEEAKLSAQEAIDAYEAELSRRPVAGCTLNDDDLRRLRDIRSGRRTAP